MKIFAAGLSTETNTFSPIPTCLTDFDVQRGADLVKGPVAYPSLDLSQTWGQQAVTQGAAFVFSLNAWAQPGGTTTRSAYESLRDEILTDLRGAMPVDVVLLMLHGAMVAQGYDSCEEDVLRRVREIVGIDIVIGVELDLHCHLTQMLIGYADVVMTFKEYPHVDINDRARELFELAVRTKLRQIRPTTALFDCRMVGMYPTSREPLRGFVQQMVQAEKSEGVLSVSFGHGFQFADVPNVGAKVIVVTNNDLPRAQGLARELGHRVYELRREIGFDSISAPMDEALPQAVASNKGPVVVADQSDNPGGGAPGDATFALQWLMEHKATNVAMAIFYDPEVVRIAHRAGVGARIRVRVGGKLGSLSGDPVDLEATVLALREGYMHGLAQRSGQPWFFPVGDVAALRCDGIDLVIGSARCQCVSPSIFLDLGIDFYAKRVLVVKSYQHFYESFSRIASEIIYMAGPGAVPPDPRQIPYRRLDTGRLYPWIDDPLP